MFVELIPVVSRAFLDVCKKSLDDCDTVERLGSLRGEELDAIEQLASSRSPREEREFRALRSLKHVVPHGKFTREVRIERKLLARFGIGPPESRQTDAPTRRPNRRRTLVARPVGQSRKRRRQIGLCKRCCQCFRSYMPGEFAFERLASRLNKVTIRRLTAMSPGKVPQHLSL